MKDKKYIIGAVICIVLFFIFDNTRFEKAGFLCIFLMLGIMSISELCKYKQKKHQLSEISFKLKRDNFIWPVINCFLFAKIAYDSNYRNVQIDGDTTMYAALDIAMFLFVFVRAYICIAHKPVLGTEGFLCSDGKFINFSRITNIVAEDNPMLKYKTLTVVCGESDTEKFKVSDVDYENVKTHIQSFSIIKVIEDGKNK